MVCDGDDSNAVVQNTVLACFSQETVRLSLGDDSERRNLAMAAVCFLPPVRFERNKNVRGYVMATIPIPLVSLLDFRFL